MHRAAGYAALERKSVLSLQSNAKWASPLTSRARQEGEGEPYQSPIAAHKAEPKVASHDTSCSSPRAWDCCSWKALLDLLPVFYHLWGQESSLLSLFDLLAEAGLPGRAVQVLLKDQSLGLVALPC